MPDPAKLHGIVLGQHVPAAYKQRDSRDPATIEAAYRYWVHRCVNINASVAASVPFKLVRVTKDADERRRLERSGVVRKLSTGMARLLDGKAEVEAPYSYRAKASRYQGGDLVEQDDHALLDLLASANQWQDGFALRESMFADLQLSGEAFMYLSGKGAIPDEVWRMMPYHIAPIPDPVTFVSGFEYRNGAETRQFGTDEVVWLKRFNPTNPYRGVGELAAWQSYSDSASHIADFNARTMQRNGAPDYIVTEADGITEPEKRAFRSAWRALFGRLASPMRESVAFMTRGKLEKLTQSNRELEFSESSRLVRDFTAAGFGVPKALLTPEDANRSTTKEANDQHLRLTVWPMVCRFFDGLNDQLVPRFGEGLMLIPENPIRQDEADLAANRMSRLQSGSSVDELREEEGLEPWGTPEAQQPLVGSGLTPLDKLGESPLGAFDFGGSDLPPEADGDDTDGPAAGDGPEEPSEPEEPAEATETRAARRQPRLCSCLPHEKGTEVWGPFDHLDLFLPLQEQANLSGPVEKRLMDETGEEGDGAPASRTDIALIALALSPVLAGLRDTLDTIAQASGWGTGGVPGDIFPGSRLSEAVAEARSLLANPLSSVVSTTGQASLNAVRPGVGIAFNVRDGRAAQYIRDSQDRIAQTLVGAFEREVRSKLIRAERSGRGIAHAAREIAASTGTQRYVAERVARTEAQFAVSFSESEAWAQSGVVVGKRFRLSANPCELCQDAAASVGNKVFAPREAVFPHGTRLKAGTRSNGEPIMVELNYMKDGLLGPPVHPNCRCRVEAVLLGES